MDLSLMSHEQGLDYRTVYVSDKRGEGSKSQHKNGSSQGLRELHWWEIWDKPMCDIYHQA